MAARLCSTMRRRKKQARPRARERRIATHPLAFGGGKSARQKGAGDRQPRRLPTAPWWQFVAGSVQGQWRRQRGQDDRGRDFAAPRPMAPRAWSVATARARQTGEFMHNYREPGRPAPRGAELLVRVRRDWPQNSSQNNSFFIQSRLQSIAGALHPCSAVICRRDGGIWDPADPQAHLGPS